MIGFYLILAGAAVSLIVAGACVIQIMFNHWLISLSMVRTGVWVAYGCIIMGLIAQMALK